MSAHKRHSTPRRKKAHKTKKNKFLFWLGKGVKVLFISAVVALVLAFLTYFFLPNVFYSLYHRVAGSYRPASNEHYDGIDVSHHNGVINWEKVATDKNIKFAYIKATEGYRHPDKMYSRNLENARKTGIKVGSYHLITTRFDMRTQFNYFKSIATRDKQDIIPMVDIEENKVSRWSKKQLRDSLAVFLRLAEDYYGTPPAIYCSYKFYKHNLTPEFDNHILFLARYSSQAPSLDNNSKCHDIWQFTEHGQIKGIEGDVDLNRLGPNTTINDLLF